MNGVKKKSYGKVFLVGAGPGDPGLITLKGLEVLKKADIIVYDRLVSDEIIGLIPKRVKRLYFGKENSDSARLQYKINQKMVEEAKKGKIVVRLKGGDPFVFGRGGEEAIYLKNRSIKFEIVPGVTSALAAPAYAGIPVSHRGLASSVAIITGREELGKKQRVPLGNICHYVDTVVILMGVRRLPEIINEIVESGKGMDTDVAIIERGTTEKQRVIFGTLNDIVVKATISKIEAPAVIVVGKMVRYGKELAWFKK